jgi:signal transduction histidine kinase/ligand-binding sensor domain-containing protein
MWCTDFPGSHAQRDAAGPGFIPLRLAMLLALATAAAPAHRLPIQSFGTAQGLPRDSVDCMVAGPNGVLWLCTTEGLVRFDGYRFRVFGTEDGLPSRNILNFAPARKGGFWVVTDHGVCRIPSGARIGDPCRLLAIDRREGDFTNNTLIETQAGDIWVATTLSLYHVSRDESRMEPSGFKVPPIQTIQALAEGWEGSLVVSTNFAVYDWKPGGEARNLSAPLGNLGLRRLLRASNEELWAVAGHDFYRISRNGIRRSRIGGSLMVDLVQLNTIARRSDGAIWSAALGGVVRLEVQGDGHVEAVERYTEADGLPAFETSWLTEDAQGDLWGTTDGAGIFRIEGGGFVSYSAKDGLGNARIGSIFEDQQGRICVQAFWGTPPQIFLKDGDRFKPVAISHPPALTYFGWGWHQYIVPAHDGEWWVPTGQGLLRFPKLKRTEDLARTAPFYYGQRSRLGGGELFRAFEDSKGDIWLVSLSPRRRVVRWERATGEFHEFTAAEGWPQGRSVTAFREDPSGTLWLGGLDGVARFRNGRFEVFSLPNQPRPMVRDLLLDHAGRLWVAALHAGIYRSDNPNDPVPLFRAYTTREGLSSGVMVAVVEDRAGFIYAGGARGVDRIDPRAPIGSRQMRHFTVADGLPESEVSTAFRDHQGHLWFGTLHGLAELDPSKLSRQAPPRVYLMRVRVRGEDVPLAWEGARTASLDLSPDHNHLEIEYAGVDLHAPESLRYQYRLEGLENGWSEPTDQLRVNYASLPPGHYRFALRAVDAEGQLSPETAGLEVFVQAPLWRRWWFLCTIALLLSGAMAAFYRYRVRNLLAMERLRNRIAADLHDDIGSSLTQISILSEVGRRGSTSSILSEIGGIARDMVAEMSEIVWAIAPRHDRLEELLHRLRRFAEDVLGGDIELRFETGTLPPGLKVPLEARRPLYLIFKEAVNNVARHSGAHAASIGMELVDNVLKLTVEDDGCGFDPAKSYPGEGLPSMARRMKDIGGSATWDSRPGGGTRFTATLPLTAQGKLHKLVGRSSRPRP